MTGPSLENVRKKLDQAGRKYTPTGDHIQAACPLPNHKHDEQKTLSLSIDYKPADRRTNMWCFVCGPARRMDEVRDALGLKLADLFDEPYTAHPSDVAQLASLRPSGNGSRSRARSQPGSQPSQCGDRHSLPPLGKPDKPARGESWFPREWERGRPIAWKVRQTCTRCGDELSTGASPMVEAAPRRASRRASCRSADYLIFWT
jgi:hypothetical protein